MVSNSIVMVSALGINPKPYIDNGSIHLKSYVANSSGYPKSYTNIHSIRFGVNIQ